MPRLSAEARAGAQYRSDLDPPVIPSNLGRNGRDLWQSIIASRPGDHWTPSAQLLLARMIRTMAAADRASAQLAREKDLADPRAITLTRQLVALNASASMLMVRLRLTPQTAHSRQQQGFNTEGGYAFDETIGGYAIHGPRIGGTGPRANGGARQ